MNTTPTIQAEIESGNQQIVAKINGRNITRGQLSFWFDRVSEKDNWKNPIDAEVYIDCLFDKFLIQNAVEFFTASKPTITKVRGKANLYRIKAAGYYLTCGA